MSEKKDTSVKEVKKDINIKEESPKRFTFNVDSGKDKDGNPVLFTFSGPEKAPLGLIYDASHRIMMEIISFIQKRAEDLKPKTPADAKKDVKKDGVKD